MGKVCSCVWSVVPGNRTLGVSCVGPETFGRFGIHFSLGYRQKLSIMNSCCFCLPTSLWPLKNNSSWPLGNNSCDTVHRQASPVSSVPVVKVELIECSHPTGEEPDGKIIWKGLSPRQFFDVLPISQSYGIPALQIPRATGVSTPEVLMFSFSWDSLGYHKSFQ